MTYGQNSAPQLPGPPACLDHRLDRPTLAASGGSSRPFPQPSTAAGRQGSGGHVPGTRTPWHKAQRPSGSRCAGGGAGAPKAGSPDAWVLDPFRALQLYTVSTLGGVRTGQMRRINEDHKSPSRAKIHSFSCDVLSPYNVPSAGLGPGDSAMNQADTSLLLIMRPVQGRRTNRKQADVRNASMC